MSKLIFILVLCNLSSFTNVSFTQDEWILVKSNPKTKVYTRMTKDSEIKEVKIEGIISADYQSVINTLNDVKNYKNWVFNCVNSKKLDVSSIHQYKYYTHTHLPFPLDDRDLVVLTTQWVTAENTWNSVSHAIPFYLPEKDKIVRIKEFDSVWKIMELSANSVKFEYIISLDPGGYIPNWAVNMGVTIGPTQTIKDLEQRSIELMNLSYKGD